MRGKLTVAGVVVGLASASFVAHAASGEGTGTSPISCQTSAWEKIPVAATKPYRAVGGLTTNVSAIYPVTVTVSGVLRGKPARFRIVDRYVDQKDVALPGPVKVTPVHGRATPFSFTWTASGDSAAVRGHQFNVSWKRAAKTGISRLLKADVVVTYHADTCTGGYTTP
jgi:hypothetical protein